MSISNEDIARKSGALGTRVITKEEAMGQKKAVHDEFKSVDNGVNWLRRRLNDFSEVIYNIEETAIWKTEGGDITKATLINIYENLDAKVNDIERICSYIRTDTSITEEIKDDVMNYKKMRPAPITPVKITGVTIK